MHNKTQYLPSQQPANQSEQQASDQQQHKQKYNQYKKSIIPPSFHKAKKLLTRMLEQYFKGLKQQIINNPDKLIIEFDRLQLRNVKSAFIKFINVRYKNISEININKNYWNQEYLLYYAPEIKSILKYTNQQKIQQIQLEFTNQYKVPDIATPVPVNSNLYFFDGSFLDEATGQFIPVKDSLKFNLVTGQVHKILSSNNMYSKIQIKSVILKNNKKNIIYILGGYVTQEKYLTKKCWGYDYKKQQFIDLSILNKLHPFPTGCIHNEKLYVFSQIGIEVYEQSTQHWKFMQLPKKLVTLPFQFCISISQNQIMIFGGKSGGKNSHNVSIVNFKQNYVDLYPQILPMGVSNERSWGPTTYVGHVAVISNVQASRYPFITNKAHTIQVIYFGNRGCFLQNVTNFDK